MRRVPAQPVVDPVVDSSRLALLVYTSGWTGRPKGVMLDHANLEAMATQMASHFQLTPADHALLVLPLFHVNSLCVSFLAPVVAGAQVTCSTASPRRRSSRRSSDTGRRASALGLLPARRQSFR